MQVEFHFFYNFLMVGEGRLFYSTRKSRGGALIRENTIFTDITGNDHKYLYRQVWANDADPDQPLPGAI